MRNNACDALRRAIEKYRATAPLAAEAGLLPYRGGERWLASPFDGDSWWTGGFWPGLMWQLWAASGDEWFKREALRAEARLTDQFRTFERLNHDVGFMYLLSCGAHHKLLGDEQARVDALHAASRHVRTWPVEHHAARLAVACRKADAVARHKGVAVTRNMVAPVVEEAPEQLDNRTLSVAVAERKIARGGGGVACLIKVLVHVGRSFRCVRKAAGQAVVPLGEHSALCRV